MAANQHCLLEEMAMTPVCDMTWDCSNEEEVSLKGKFMNAFFHLYKGAELHPPESWLGERRKRRENLVKNKLPSLAQKGVIKIIQEPQIKSKAALHLEVKVVWESARERLYRNTLLTVVINKQFLSPHILYVLFSRIIIRIL